MAEDQAYSWYDGKPTSNVVSASIPDARKLPMNYPQGGGGRDLSTGCRIDGNFRDPAGNLQCCWGQPSSGDKHRCMYLKFGIMCDKLTASDGKEIN
jgi:hypothetical protein